MSATLRGVVQGQGNIFVKKNPSLLFINRQSFIRKVIKLLHFLPQFNLKTKSKYFFLVNEKSCIPLSYILGSSLLFSVFLPLKITAKHSGMRLTWNSSMKQFFSWKILIHCVLRHLQEPRCFNRTFTEMQNSKRVRGIIGNSLMIVKLLGDKQQIQGSLLPYLRVFSS